MITLKKIQITDFLSHQKTEINFQDNQKLLLEGASGSGKSAIVEAISWNLYGKARSDNRSLIKKGSSQAKVILIVKDDNTFYKIERSINLHGRHELKVLEWKGKKYTPIKALKLKDTQEYLERKILHSSYLLFNNSIYYPQEATENFVRQTAAKRKDILLEIINAESYDEYYKKAIEKIREKKEEKNTLLSKIEERQLAIKEDKEKADKLKEYEEGEKRIKKEIIKVENDIEIKNEKIKNIEVKIHLLKEKENNIAQYSEKIEINKRKISDLNKRAIELQKTNVEELKKKKEELQSLRKQLDELEKQKEIYFEWNKKMTALIQQAPADYDHQKTIDEINKQMIEVIKEKDFFCPELKKSCPVLKDKKDSNIAELNQKLKVEKEKQTDFERRKKEHQKKIDNLETKELPSNNKIEDIRNKIKELEPIEKKLLEIESKKVILDEINENIKNLEKENVDLSLSVEKIKKETANLDQLKSQKDNFQQEVANHEKTKQSLNLNYNNNLELLTIARQADNRIQKNKQTLDKLKKESKEIQDNLESLELIKEAFSQTGIKAIMIDWLIPQLEDKINDILSRLSDFRIRLDTQKGGIGKNTILEGLFIDVINEQNEIFSFNNYSGGEKLRITIAIAEGLAAIQKINFRILDEAIIGLDEESTDNFARVILALKDRFSQMICISHIPKIKELFEDKIIINKINGISKI